MKRGEVVHAGDVGRALHEGEAFAGLLHPGVEVADDRLGPADHLAFELDLEPEHAVGRWMLGAHVDDHALVLGQLVVEGVVVFDHDAALLLQPEAPLVLRISWAPSSVEEMSHSSTSSGSSLPEIQRSNSSRIVSRSASLPADSMVSSVSLVVIRSPCERL